MHSPRFREYRWGADAANFTTEPDRENDAFFSLTISTGPRQTLHFDSIFPCSLSLSKTTASLRSLGTPFVGCATISLALSSCYTRLRLSKPIVPSLRRARTQTLSCTKASLGERTVAPCFARTFHIHTLCTRAHSTCYCVTVMLELLTQGCRYCLSFPFNGHISQRRFWGLTHHGIKKHMDITKKSRTLSPSLKRLFPVQIFSRSLLALPLGPSAPRPRAVPHLLHQRWRFQLLSLSPLLRSR